MGRVSQAGMRGHLRERNNMSNSNKQVGEDAEGCVMKHSNLDSRYCPECGKKVNK